MAVVAVVCPVADPPAMVRYQNRRVSDVANKIVDLFVAAEALVTTACMKLVSLQVVGAHNSSMTECQWKVSSNTARSAMMRVLTSHAQPQTAPRT